jgi:hypothetical protein
MEGIMSTFNIAEVAVTHTCYYNPAVYLEHCADLGVEPNEEEYLNFIQDEIDEDFPSFDHHVAQIIYNSPDND